MTQPVQEPTTQRSISVGGWGQRQLERRPALSGGANFVGIVFPATEPVLVENTAGGWFLAIPQDLNGSTLMHVAAVVYTPDTQVEMQVHNVTQAVDMLSTPITIDAGEQSSYTAATPPVIDAGNAQVATADIITVDVDDDGAALGLDIILAFS